MARTVNEIKTRTADFVREWQVAPTAREAAEEQTRETGFIPVVAIVRLRRKSLEQALNSMNIRNPIELSKWCWD